jgi:hypothetical protein
MSVIVAMRLREARRMVCIWLTSGSGEVQCMHKFLRPFFLLLSSHLSFLGYLENWATEGCMSVLCLSVLFWKLLLKAYMVVGRCLKTTYSGYMLVGRADLMSCDGGDRAKGCGINSCLEESCCFPTHLPIFLYVSKIRERQITWLENRLWQSVMTLVSLLAVLSKNKATPRLYLWLFQNLQTMMEWGLRKSELRHRDAIKPSQNTTLSTSLRRAVSTYAYMIPWTLSYSSTHTLLLACAFRK